jgi:serine/threonine protein kinase
MPAQAACPSAQVLQGLLLGKLPEDEVESLGKHLLGCDQCAARVHSLAKEDTLVEALRTARTPAVDEPKPEKVQGLIERLKALRLSEGGSTQALPAAEESSNPHEFLAPAQGPDEIGRLGDYRVLKVLGTGGMGMVYLAQDTRLDREVALKVMKPSVAANPQAKQRFLREAKACAALRHDHIITIYQVGEDRGVPFLAMEFLEGMPLDQWLSSGRKLTIPQILRIGREIAKGLAAAHEKGLIHRDIKPGNVWLDKHSGRVKILDFGLARTAKEDVNITQSGAIVGTPAYMAPEQARGEKVDGRCDLFSLGCVLYRLCTGDIPFKGETTMAVLMALGMETQKPARDVNPLTPPALSELIDRLLAKTPEQRPASAKEVVQAIQTIERSQSTTRVPVPTPAPAPVASPVPLPPANPFQDLTEASSKLVVPPKSVSARTSPKKAAASAASGGCQAPGKA